MTPVSNVHPHLLGEPMRPVFRQNFSVFFGPLFGLLISLVVASQPATAASNQFVVIASNTNNNQVPAGKTFTGDQKITLIAGESLTLISQTGKVVNLQGPYSNAITPKGNTQGDTTAKQSDSEKSSIKDWPTTLTKITKLVTKDGNRTAVIGASRMVVPGPEGSTAIDMTNDFWFMNVDSSGDRCVRSKDVFLWRDNPSQAINIDLRSQDAKRTGILWKQHKYQMELPSEFIKDGILIVMKIDKQPRRFNLHVLPQWIKEKDLGKVLLWMVNRNCTRQSQRLINSLQANM